MKASFIRRRKMTRGVLVLDGSLAGLEPQPAVQEVSDHQPASGRDGP
jgi:hypothetical protein